MSNVPAGGFKMGHKGYANKTARKPIKRAQRKQTFGGAGALAAYDTLMQRFDEVPRAQVVELYLRCVVALESSPGEEEIT